MIQVLQIPANSTRKAQVLGVYLYVPDSTTTNIAKSTLTLENTLRLVPDLRHYKACFNSDHRELIQNRESRRYYIYCCFRATESKLQVKRRLSTTDYPFIYGDAFIFKLNEFEEFDEESNVAVYGSMDDFMQSFNNHGKAYSMVRWMTTKGR